MSAATAEAKTCENNSYLDCLLCEYFIATIDRIPFFEEQINAIDKKTENALIIHDREDLVNKKRLLVNYLSRLLCLTEGEIDYEREC